MHTYHTSTSNFSIPGPCGRCVNAVIAFLYGLVHQFALFCLAFSKYMCTVIFWHALASFTMFCEIHMLLTPKSCSMLLQPVINATPGQRNVTLAAEEGIKGTQRCLNDRLREPSVQVRALARSGQLTKCGSTNTRKNLKLKVHTDI